MTPEQFQKQCEMYAMYWLSVANTGAYKQRCLYHTELNMQKTPLTDEEKLQDTLEIARNHIALHRQSCEKGIIE